MPSYLARVHVKSEICYLRFQTPIPTRARCGSMGEVNIRTCVSALSGLEIICLPGENNHNPKLRKCHVSMASSVRTKLIGREGGELLCPVCRLLNTAKKERTLSIKRAETRT